MHVCVVHGCAPQALLLDARPVRVRRHLLAYLAHRRLRDGVAGGGAVLGRVRVARGRLFRLFGSNVADVAADGAEEGGWRSGLALGLRLQLGLARSERLGQREECERVHPALGLEQRRELLHCAGAECVACHLEHLQGREAAARSRAHERAEAAVAELVHVERERLQMVDERARFECLAQPADALVANYVIAQRKRAKLRQRGPAEAARQHRRADVADGVVVEVEVSHVRERFGRVQQRRRAHEEGVWFAQLLRREVNPRAVEER
eukprot:4999928-Pleurochrysis_carterae.AAC.3